MGYIFELYNGNQLFILGISLTMKKKFYTVISALFAIAGVSAILDNFVEFEIFAIIGWMGGFYIHGNNGCSNSH